MNKKALIFIILMSGLWVLSFGRTGDLISRFLLLGMLVLTVLLYVTLAADARKNKQKHEESEKRAIQAELNEKQQRLLALENQINPHFLYNTLDTFRGLALEGGNRELSDMIEALSQMFKYSVKYDGEVVTVNEELHYLQQYIKIQQTRFPERFEYFEHIECSEAQLLAQTCPRLILQPIVENAIRHGFEGMRKGGEIHLFCSYKKCSFSLLIEDNGKGMDSHECSLLNQKLSRMTGEESDAAHKNRRGIGITNVNRRIKLFCGEEYGLHYVSVPEGGTQVEITIPAYREMKECLSDD